MWRPADSRTVLPSRERSVSWIVPTARLRSQPDRPTPTTPPRPPDQAGSANLAAALDYLKHGFFPLILCPWDCPCNHGGKDGHTRDRAGKVPLQAGWTKAVRLPTADEALNLWRDQPRGNVGVRLGQISGLVGIDIDPPEGESALAQLCHGERPVTWEFETGGGGRRLLFSWQKDRPMPTRHMGNKYRSLSLLCDGSQTVMPPSMHHSGRRYVWIAGRGPADAPLAEAPPWLRVAMQNDPPKAGRTGGGRVVPPEEGSDLDQLLYRAGLYLRGCEEAEWGHGGDSRTYKIACKLVGMFGLPPALAFQLLCSDWNARCKPPWSERDLERKVLKAVEGNTEERVALWPDWHRGATPPPTCSSSPRPDEAPAMEGRSGAPGKHPSDRRDERSGSKPVHTADRNGEATAGGCVNGRGPAGVIPPTPGPGVAHPPPADQGGQLGNGQGGASGPPKQRKAGRLLSEFTPRETEWFLKPFFARRSLTLITGRSDSGKTTFLSWVVAQAKRPVLFPGFELDLESMTVPKLLAAGAPADGLLMQDGVELFLADGPDRLIEALRDHRADLVAFDPLTSYLAADGEENLPAVVRRGLQNLCLALRETGAAGVGLLHPGKAAGNVLRGAASWRDVPRVVLELRHELFPVERRRILVEKWSFEDKPPEHLFEIVRGDNGAGLFRLLGPVSGAVTAALRQDPETAGGRAVHDARLFLRSFLADGKQLAGQVFIEGGKLDHKTTTLRLAADLDGVDRPQPEKPGPRAEWWWIPPDVWPPLEGEE